MKKYFGRKFRQARQSLTARTRRTLNAFDHLEARCLLSATPYGADPHIDHAERDAVGYEYHALTTLPGAELATTSSGGSTGSTWAAFDPAQTFLLNSNPGARHTIYLDFDGHRTTGTAWNSSFNGGADIVTAAYDFDGNPLAFSTTELERIQRIWQRVAEDYLPFDVNVTTQDPGAAALTKSGSTDSAWGVRIVIGGSCNDWLKSSAGGIAYLDSFNWNSDTPAFVFENELGNGHEKYTAEAISHEAGHTLGLRHDGTATSGYYTGHGSGATGWAPIMGAGYYRELTQWSRGEYTGADNAEDDLAIITTRNGFSYRADDFGNTYASATNLNADGTSLLETGILERAGDIDTFSFYVGAGALDLTLSPALRGANVDLLAELYDASYNLIASSNPADLLTASLSLTVTTGRYFLQVSGVGRGDPATGYSDYASLGAYQLTGQVTAAPQQPSYVSIEATDADKEEGNDGSTPFTFTVTRTGDTSRAATVTWAVTGVSSDPASASDFSDGVHPTGTVSFAAGETAQTITIDVRDDGEVEATEAFQVTLVAAEGAEIETGAAIGTIYDDDDTVQPGVIVTALKELATTEGGGQVRFSVVLETAPTKKVFIQIRSLDKSEGHVNKPQLVFTPNTWDKPQYFVVRGVDDRAVDGDVSYVVRVGRTKSFDPNYNRLGPGDFVLTNYDDDTFAGRWGFRWRSAVVETSENRTTGHVAAAPFESLATPSSLRASAVSEQPTTRSGRESPETLAALPATSHSSEFSWSQAVDRVMQQTSNSSSADSEDEDLVLNLASSAAGADAFGLLASDGF